MLTARENLIETIKPGGKPDRFVNNYEALQLVMNPAFMTSPMPEPGGPEVVNAWGVTNSWPAGTPGSFPVHTPDKIVVKDIDTWRDAVKAPSTDYADAMWEPWQAAIEGIKADNRAMGGVFWAPGLFEQTHHLCSIDEALVYYMTDGDEMKDMIKYIKEFELKNAELICDKLAPEAIFHHDDWGTENNSFMRPEMFEEFFVEPYKEIYGYYKSRGVSYIFHHSDAYGANLVPYMIEMGIDVWQGVMESNNTKDLLEKYAGQIAFMGNIDNKDVDFEGWTPEDCYRVAREHLEGYDFQSYIPCITQGGPGSTFPGTYAELVKGIDMYNSEKFGFTMEELEAARPELQIMF